MKQRKAKLRRAKAITRILNSSPEAIRILALVDPYLARGLSVDEAIRRVIADGKCTQEEWDAMKPAGEAVAKALENKGVKR